MKRSRATLAFLFLLPFPLFAQAPSPASAPAAAPAFPPPAHGEKLRITGIPHAGKITETLYRGAQPREVGLSELKILGITTIVDLRGEDREKIAWERKRAESLGMRFVNIPVSGWSPPTDEQVVQFLSLFRGDPGKKIFVHCRFGDDRTGVFTAVYRMAIEKWSAEQAMNEMYFFGFNGFWHPSMKTFVHDFPARFDSAPSFAPLHIPTSPPAPAKPAVPPQPGTLAP
jgi:tyrosine-protein phosphatase SIW14